MTQICQCHDRSKHCDFKNRFRLFQHPVLYVDDDWLADGEDEEMRVSVDDDGAGAGGGDVGDDGKSGLEDGKTGGLSGKGNIVLGKWKSKG
ncbi:unnamed protein product [Ambrosiozyma monospora]|uniref:Unnamed protein product n=1 Tax=Ambrosiozyma monospora TaxID=43982 RepID=A0ACB5U1Z5_AMBMO|nr:unnamed protein product [Ambrosiozyma monospora]